MSPRPSGCKVCRRPASRPHRAVRRRGTQGRRRGRTHARVPRPLPRPRRRDQSRSTGAARTTCASASCCTGWPTVRSPRSSWRPTRISKVRRRPPTWRGRSSRCSLRVTRLASGLPVGGDLEYADEVTLGRAFSGRRVVDDAARCLTRRLRPDDRALTDGHRSRELSDDAEASLARSAAALDEAFADDIATQISAFLLSLARDRPRRATRRSAFRCCCWRSAS